MQIVIRHPKGTAPDPKLYRGPAGNPVPWETIPRNRWIMIAVDPPGSVGDSIAAIEAAGMPAGYTFSRLWVSPSSTYALIERTDDV